jgi:hypothetical protein
MALSLHAHGRLLTTPFGLLGTDENALSFALAYTFQQCVPLLQSFLRQIGIQGIQHTTLSNARIDLQRHRKSDLNHGITDIEIHLPGYFHIVIEAKVGLAVPSIEQCRKYLPCLLHTNEPIQTIIALVQSADDSFAINYAQDPELAKRLICFNWSNLLPEITRILMGNSVGHESKSWVRSLYHFLDQEYRMKAFTTEVWILSIDTKRLWPDGMSFWDIHQKYLLYFDRASPTVRPLYLGFRVNGLLDSIYRVNRIEHETPVIKRVPELVNLPAEWPKEPYTIWHFDQPVKLPNPIRTGAGMYNRRVRCDLDLLLTCKTVKEIEQAMGNRRN